MQIEGLHPRWTKSDSLEVGLGICILTSSPSSAFDASIFGENTDLGDS